MSPVSESKEMPDSPQGYTTSHNTANIALDVSCSMPDIADLVARLRFLPGEGQIWLDDQRMLLIHASSLGTLRRELIESVGIDIARGILTRFGYSSGARDADLARKLRPPQTQNPYDTFLVGPQLHALEGIVFVEPVRLELDIERGKYYSEFLWKNSSEDESHIQDYGVGDNSACWMQIGYASGYTSAFMGRPILFREIECRSLGQNVCRIIGKPVEEWEDAEEDLRYLRIQRIQPFTQGLSSLTPPPSERLDEYVSHHQRQRVDNEIIGTSAGFNVAYHMLKRVAATQATVLFSGESGVGKDVFAKALHRQSSRADQPFIALNCAAIPEYLVEAELFGVEKGAFTGALQTRIGRFERAHKGTLFLDEIGIISLSAQSKILRAIQEREIERVGDNQTRKIDVRLIAATNLDLKKEVEAGRFREDLYFRLNVFPIHIPPLRERREDIPLLMYHFLQKFNQRDQRSITGFTTRAIDAVLSYSWPGNIRELENMIERGAILAREGGPIDLPHLFTYDEQLHTQTFSLGKNGLLIQSAGLNKLEQDAENSNAELLLEQVALMLRGEANADTSLSLERLENALLRSAVQSTQGNLSAAAKILGITRPQLVYRLNKESKSAG